MRGRPPKPPEDRAPKRSGPSGKHAQVTGDALFEQRRQLAPDMDPHAGLPLGMPAIIAARLGMPERAGAERVRQMWAGKRRYRPMAKIF